LQRLTLSSLTQMSLQVVAQERATDHAALKSLLNKTTSQGGEGLMLHRGGSFYRSLRSDDLLKFKPFDDAEARVIAHVPGQGKFEGMLGALLVETPEGRRFKLGTGFSDAQRRDPPALGAWVTYRFRDVTSGGLPRFASFLRLREDFEPI
jgi:DNA ligase-1